jgi:hypothetical protein
LAAKMAAIVPGLKLCFRQKKKYGALPGSYGSNMLVFSQKAGILKDKIEKKRTCNFRNTI